MIADYLGWQIRTHWADSKLIVARNIKRWTSAKPITGASVQEVKVKIKEHCNRWGW